jgi:hypothetical protein
VLAPPAPLAAFNTPLVHAVPQHDGAKANIAVLHAELHEKVTSTMQCVSSKPRNPACTRAARPVAAAAEEHGGGGGRAG